MIRRRGSRSLAHDTQPGGAGQRRDTPRVTLILSLVLAVLLVACGGEDESEPETGAAPETPLETETSAEGDGEGSDGEDGSASDWDSVVAAAEEEGELTLYSAQSEAIVETTTEAFMEEYPNIRVRFLRLSSGPLNNRYAGELDSEVHEADVFNSATNELWEQYPDNFLALDEDIVPNIADWPERFRDEKYVVTSQGEQSIVYNTDLIPDAEAPTSWEDLIDPKYQGKCLWIDPRSSPTYMSWLSLMQEGYGDEFIEALGNQNCTLTDSGTPTTQEVAAGGALIGFPPTPSHYYKVIDEGAPVAGVFAAANSPVPAHGPQHYYGIPSTAQNPNAARVYLNWYLTTEAQEINCAGVYSTPVADAEGCVELSDDYEGARFDLSDERISNLVELAGLD